MRVCWCWAGTVGALAVYQARRALPPCRLLFESCTGGEQVARFSFLGAGPREVYRLYPDRLEVGRAGGRGRRGGDEGWVAGRGWERAWI